MQGWGMSLGTCRYEIRPKSIPLDLLYVQIEGDFGRMFRFWVAHAHNEFMETRSALTAD